MSNFLPVTTWLEALLICILGMLVLFTWLQSVDYDKLVDENKALRQEVLELKQEVLELRRDDPWLPPAPRKATADDLQRWQNITASMGFCNTCNISLHEALGEPLVTADDRIICQDCVREESPFF